MAIPLEYVINDIRLPKEFEKKSFSGYSTKEVLSNLKKNILDSKIEVACQMTIELMLSLQTHKLYDLFLSLAIKNININNPKLPIKLFNRLNLYITSNISNGDARNSQVIRNHLIELCVILSNSKKTKAITLTSIKEEDFNTKNIVSKVMANSDIIDIYRKQHDPSEIKIMLNEFLFNLLNKNYDGMVYWLSWLIHYDKMSSKKKKPLICSKRFNEGISDKNQTDIVWFFWDIVITEANKKLNKKCFIQVVHLFKIYKLLYKHSSKYKYIYLLLYSLKYLTTIFNIDRSICSEPFLYIQACSNVNLIFKEKKQYEKYKSNINFLTQNNLVRDSNIYKMTTPKNIKKQQKETKKNKLKNSLTKFNLLNDIDGIDTNSMNSTSNTESTFMILNEIDKLSK